MTRRMRSQWFRGMVSSDHRPARPGAARDVRRRPLRLEPLEDRRLLATITVNTIVDENDGVATGGVSFRDALAAAASGDTIDFDPALTSGGPATIDLAHGQLVANTAVTIDGPGAELLTIDAGGTSRVFRAFADCTIEGLTLTGGNAPEGGGILTHRVTVRDSVITGNTSTGGGGGIAANYVTLERTRVTGNQSGFWGGGVQAFRAYISESTISGNSSDFGGGGIAVLGASARLALTSSTVSGNTAPRAGAFLVAHVYFEGSFVAVNQSTISGNTATEGLGSVTDFYFCLLSRIRG
ncbi:MAG: hypothetical protein DCC67_07680 [Planctomycetota bacterium]|nr:MAG: hypothetical protein DCC67_07680 [Planctomycetota bacterium]